ncbi:unnamed protein product, partial [Effrenium voratum]
MLFQSLVEVLVQGDFGSVEPGQLIGVGRFELRAGWEVFPDSPVYSTTNSGRLQLQSETPVNWPGVNRFRRVWAGLAVALIAKDCFSVPLMPFGTDMTFWSFDILAAIFWTLNLPVSCWLARSKATVWPLFLAQTLVELVLIAPTFVDLLNHGQPHPLQSILRVLQLFRLLQASHWYKITGMSHMVREWLRHRSREFRAFWNIASIMLIGVLLIHLITCMWFAAGVGGEDSWVDELDITDKSWQQQYLLSFEWAIGRLPPSHLPENMKLARRSERFVALLGTGLMILFGSIFTSMITNDISDIRRAHRERKEADYHVRVGTSALSVPNCSRVRLLSGASFPVDGNQTLKLHMPCPQNWPCYASGGKLKTQHKLLPDFLTAEHSSGFSFHEAESLVFVSYLHLQTCAQHLATGLRRLPDRCVILDPDLSRRQTILSFWGCLIAGLRPCLVQGDLLRAWEQLGRPSILSDSASFKHPCKVDLSLLQSTGQSATLTQPMHQSVFASQSSLSSHAFHVICSGHLYSYSHEAVLANALAINGLASTSTRRLSWMPVTSAFVILSHCAAVLCGASEVHCDGSEPRRLLPLLRATRCDLLAAPLIFFRRALGLVRSGAGAGLAGSFATWLLGEAGAAWEEFRSLVRAPTYQVLVAPWGTVLAQDGCPLPGLEMRYGCGQPGNHSHPGNHNHPSHVRGLVALPAASASVSKGWVPLEQKQPELVHVSGVTYTSDEIEAAVELAPEVLPGSAVAMDMAGLVVFFVPSNAAACCAEKSVQALKSHLALSLGIHARFNPLAACKTPRAPDGAPLRGPLRELEPYSSQSLPDDWILEEDFKASAVQEDEDALEERMEGVEVPASSSKTYLLVQAASTLTVAPALRAGGATIIESCCEGAAEVLETLDGEVVVVNLLQCGDDSEGSAVSCFIGLLRSWERRHNDTKIPLLRILCVSVGRHPRVGPAKDPRKHFLSGVLLCALAELPWLRARQLDVGASSLPEAVLQELSDFGDLDDHPEVLVDEGHRLLRRLKSVKLSKKASPERLRAALLAGGAGGVGTLWASHLNADSLILLGRAPASRKHALQLLEAGTAAVRYLQVDVGNKEHLRAALRDLPDLPALDLAANLCESFPAPRPVLELQTLEGPKAKLRAAQNFIEILTELQTQRRKLPVLFTSTAVSVMGAPRLGEYAAGARAVEALCAQHASGRLEVRCAALSAWDGVGITQRFPALAQAAPGAGLHVLSPRLGVLALEAVLGLTSVVAVGLDAAHPRLLPLTGGKARSSLTVTSLPGCVEVVQAAVRKVLSREAQLADSFVELGMDSMTSMSLHSALCDSSGQVLPLSIFYEQPTVLEVATFLHGKSGTGAEGAETGLESLLEDVEARRSYYLSLARDAFARGNLQAARQNARLAAGGHAGLTALALLAACGTHGRSLWAASCAARGADHVDSAVALARLALEANAKPMSDKLVEGENGEELEEGESEEAREIILDFEGDWSAAFAQQRRRFMLAITWVSGAGWATIGFSGAVLDLGKGFQQLTFLNLDGQQLESVSCLGMLKRLEVLKLRRNLISVVPDSLGQLGSLRELWLTCNALRDLPEVSWPKLQVLCLERNRFARLPALAQLRKLQQLGLDEQQPGLTGSSGSSGSGSLTSALVLPILSVLRGRNCGHESLPGLQCPNLNSLFWANNGLQAIPLLNSSLRLLDLAHNQISCISENIFELHVLRDLSLAGNRLQQLPDLSKLKGLQQLWLHGNLLESLPSLDENRNLAILELHHNRLQSLPSLSKLQKLNWLFAHGNLLSDVGLFRDLANLPRLKVVGLGCNRLPLHDLDLQHLRASFGLAWNPGLTQELLTEALTTTEIHWDLMAEKVQEILVITFSAQGAPVAQGQAEVRALRDAFLKVDALYVCDPANAWFLQDPTLQWRGLEHLSYLGYLGYLGFGLGMDHPDILSIR